MSYKLAFLEADTRHWCDPYIKNDPERLDLFPKILDAFIKTHEFIEDPPDVIKRSWRIKMQHTPTEGLREDLEYLNTLLQEMKNES